MTYDTESLDTPAVKPYLDASRFAEILGVPRSVIVADVKAGMAGKIGTLTGVVTGGVCVAQASDLEQGGLEYHRARLSVHSTVATDTSSEVQP